MQQWGEEGEQRVDKEDQEPLGLQAGQAGVGAQHAGDVDQRVGAEDDQRHGEEAAALLEVAHGDDAHHSRHQLVEDELIAVGHHIADDDDGHDVDIECHAHIEEYVHQYRHHAHRHDEHHRGVGAHHHRHGGRDEDDDEEGEGHLLDVVEHRMAYVFQEDIERHEGYDAQQGLAQIGFQSKHRHDV